MGNLFKVSWQITVSLFISLNRVQEVRVKTYGFLLEEMPYHLVVSFEWIIQKILCGVVALDFVLSKIFFTVKKQFSSKKIQLKTLFKKYILL